MNDEQKLEALREMTGMDITALGAAKKAEAEDAGRESKEVAPEPVAEAAPEQGGVGITPELIGQAMATALQPLLARIDALEQKSLTPPEPEQDPMADLMASYNSNVIGQKEAFVDGRTKEAKDVPLETVADGFRPSAKVGGNGLGNTSINRIYDGQLRKELVERPR